VHHTGERMRYVNPACLRAVDLKSQSALQDAVASDHTLGWVVGGFDEFDVCVCVRHDVILPGASC